MTFMPRQRERGKEVNVEAISAARFFPVLTTDRIIECVDFYHRHFGFDVVFEADWYVHLVSETGLQLGFLKPNHPSQPEFLHRSYPGEGVVYSFDVDDVDQEFRKLADSDVDVLYELTTETWGQRHFMIRDPGGMIVDIVQAIAVAEERDEGA